MVRLLRCCSLIAAPLDIVTLPRWSDCSPESLAREDAASSYSWRVVPLPRPTRLRHASRGHTFGESASASSAMHALHYTWFDSMYLHDDLYVCLLLMIQDRKTGESARWMGDPHSPKSAGWMALPER